MLYYGNEREDGRVMQPHELVYDGYILNCLTGILNINETEVNIPIDDNPIDFLISTEDCNYTLKLFVMYSDYAKLYKIRDNFDIVKIKNIGKFNHQNCIIDGEDIIVKDDSHKKIYENFVNKCKQVTHIILDYFGGLYSECSFIIYIDYDNKVHCDDGNYTLFGRFIIINCWNCLCIYDIEKEIFYDEYDGLFDEFTKLKNKITDIKVYRDNIEVYTSEGNYYIDYVTPNEKCFKPLPDGWSVKPTFNMRSKSARKID